MKLRYAGKCRVCSFELPKGSDVVYESATKTVRCVVCAMPQDAPRGVESAASLEPAAAIDPGVPGASARRQFERRQAQREERIRAKHKRLGGLILAVSDDPQSTRARDTGAIGEERLGARLNELAGPSTRVLHNRKIPRSSANVDHLAVTPNGVNVIDAKRNCVGLTLVGWGRLTRSHVE